MYIASKNTLCVVTLSLSSASNFYNLRWFHLPHHVKLFDQAVTTEGRFFDSQCRYVQISIIALADQYSTTKTQAI